ncbi:MAG: Antitoxin VapB47 [Chloroflexi bacterium]|nr:Antitoxin VapB47 [Chloroflexota bacterium]
MHEPQVGIRELKTHLSKYLRHVKAGETLVITEYGKPIGRIVPKRSSLEDRSQALVDAGLARWNGTKLAPKEPQVVNRSDKLLSDIVVEEREIDTLS